MLLWVLVYLACASAAGTLLVLFPQLARAFLWGWSRVPSGWRRPAG